MTKKNYLQRGYENDYHKEKLVSQGLFLSHRYYKCRLPALSGSDPDPCPQKNLKVPQRPFGKSGINVSILSLGGMFDIKSNQIMIKQALRWGVTYWDTADCYQRGSEKGIGKYFQKHPEDRKKVFLVTKSDARDPKGMSKLLDRSLNRMKTDYIDLDFIHGIDNIDEFDTRTRAWAEKAKAAAKIRLFGFSTHSNMEECMQEAAAEFS